MESFLTESGLELPELATLIRFLSRLVFAVLLGGAVGWDRERRGRAAGLRTHMLVSLGTALFTLVATQQGADASHVAELVKGIAAGIGFIGAGAILKIEADRDIQGLTTAASIWLTAAVGMAAGLGYQWMALAAVILSLVVLALFTTDKKSNGHDDA